MSALSWPQLRVLRVLGQAEHGAELGNRTSHPGHPAPTVATTTAVVLARRGLVDLDHAAPTLARLAQAGRDALEATS